MKRRLISLSMVLLLMVAHFGVGLASGDYPDPDYGATPRLTLTGELPILDAGKAGELKFSLTNYSPYVAYSVTLRMLEGPSDIFRPTVVSGVEIAIGTVRIGNANAVSVTVPVEVFDDVPEGYYTVPLQFSMRNNAGMTIEQSGSIRVFISNPVTEEITGTPSLTLSSATVDTNTPPSDGAITLMLNIVNIGDGRAGDARISLTGFKSSEITLDESLVTKSLGTIDSGDNATATYSLKVAPELPSGSYPLDVEVKYKLPDGSERTMSDVAYINIIRPPVTSPGSGDVQLTNITQDVSNPGSSNIVRLTLTFQNKGTLEAQDVAVGFIGLSSSAFTLSGDFGDRRLENIAPGESATTTFSMYVSPGLPNGNHPLTVMIKYSNPGAAESQVNTVETEIYLHVNRPPEPTPTEPPPPETDTSVPRVIISRHSISVDNVVAGSPFSLQVTLLNTSTTKNVKNMKVTVNDINGVFIPVEGTNSFYVAQIPTGQTTDISITLVAKQDAETKSYPLSITLDYEDDKNTPYSVTESLSIPVYLPQRLELMNVMFNEDGIGMAYLSFQFVNKGKSPLYNLNIRIEGSMSAMEGDYHVGTFGPGQMDYFEDTIIPFMFGELEGFIVLEYEDSAGEPQEFRHPLQTYINEPFYPDFEFPGEGEWPIEPGGPGDDFWLGEDSFGEESDGMPLWLILSIIGAVVLIGLILIIASAKKTKRKKLELEDDAYIESKKADSKDIAIEEAQKPDPIDIAYEEIIKMGKEDDVSIQEKYE